MTKTERAMALLEALDPIVLSHVESGSPCGDPMGIEHWSINVRLSDVLADGGWLKARPQRELSRLMAVLVDGDLL